MSYSKPFILFAILFAVTLLISSQVSARDLAAKTKSVEDAKYYGGGGGYYPGHGGGSYYPGHGHGGGSYYPGHGHGGGSYYPGHGHGGYGGHYPPKGEKVAQGNGN